MKIKYIYIPISIKVKETRFFIGFKSPDNEGYFYINRQSCKKIPEDDEKYLVKLDLDKKYNHKLKDMETNDNVGVISDLDIFPFFEECTDFNIISLAFPKKTVIKKENLRSNVEDLVVRAEILEKEIEILKLRFKKLEN